MMENDYMELFLNGDGQDVLFRDVNWDGTQPPPPQPVTNEQLTDQDRGTQMSPPTQNGIGRTQGRVIDKQRVKRQSLFGARSGPRAKLEQYMTRPEFLATKKSLEDLEEVWGGKEIKSLNERFQRQKAKFLNVMARTCMEKVYQRVMGGDRSEEGFLQIFCDTIGLYFIQFEDGDAKEAVEAMRPV